MSWLFVFGILEEECENSYLANVDVLEKVNHSTVAAFFSEICAVNLA